MHNLQTISPHNAADLRLLASYRVRWITELVWAPREPTMILASAHHVALYHFRGGAGVQRERLEGHTEPIRTVDIDRAGAWLVSGSDDNTLRRWSIAPGAPRRCLVTPTTEPVEKVRFAPNGDVVMASGTHVYYYPFGAVPEATDIRPQILPSDEEDKIAVTFSPDGKWLALGGWSGEIRLFARADLSAPYAILQRHEHRVNNLLFDHQTRRLLSVGRDGRLVLWSMPDGAVLADMMAHDEEPIDVLRFSPDHRILATGGRDNKLRLWDAEHLAPLGVLAEHRRPPIALGFRADGALLATGSGDNTLRLWGLPSAG